VIVGDVDMDSSVVPDVVDEAAVVDEIAMPPLPPDDAGTTPQPLFQNPGRHVEPDVRVDTPSFTSFDVMYSTIPATGDVIAESRAAVDANGVTHWSRTLALAHDAVMTAPATEVV
jgi:hypothetical protein